MNKSSYIQPDLFQFLTELKNTVLNSDNKYVISIGGGMPCYPDNREILNSIGYNFWLISDIDIMIQRVRDSDRPLLKQRSINDIKNLYKSRIKDYALSSDAVVLNNSIKQCAKKIINEISILK